MYYWSNKKKVSGFDPLHDFFSYCSNLGFQNFIIHAPYGNTRIDQHIELEAHRKKLATLALHINLEVEEIATSNKELHDTYVRFYKGERLEDLMKNQKATPLLDTYECGGIEETINRIQDLASKSFKINTIHLHKDKHKLLTNNEFEQLLQFSPYKNFVNEGFIKPNSSFDTFVQTKSTDCIVPNNQRIEILKKYKEKIEQKI